MNKMCTLHKVSWVLVIIGGLNWGLIGAFDYNLVNALIGNWPSLERIVYVLVGLAAVALLFLCKSCKACKAAK
ncbi:DUF378 domain-containing protein [Patescibacteria group bacterium]|nr:DUF378 domain-containing protein [Patescibacteria group bacterium]MBU2509652.1 DUF378 domain-containing protein [Patescibacteria group bacterium]